MSDDAVSIPRFTWQKPTVNNLNPFNLQNIQNVQIFYEITLWKMFENDGTILVKVQSKKESIHVKSSTFSAEIENQSVEKVNVE